MKTNFAQKTKTTKFCTQKNPFFFKLIHRCKFFLGYIQYSWFVEMWSYNKSKVLNSPVKQMLLLLD